MKVAVVADAHLGGPGGDAGPLVEQLLALPAAGATDLLLLGDLFQVWVGFPQYETADIARLLVAVDRLRASGVRVVYVEGNRDFFVGEGPYAARFDRVGLEAGYVVAGVRYLAVHGDGLNDRDRQYLFWRWLSKSAPIEATIRHLPASLVGRLVDRTERGLSGTNFKHKRRVPEEAIRAYAERRLAEGHDLLMLGHFHEGHAWRVAGGDVRLLEPWFRSRRVEWLGAGDLAPGTRPPRAE